jgi:6,7-dimethyl-8-ribityllumazine synthase
MGKTFEGMLTGEGLRFGVVVSRYNEFITNKLLSGTKDGLIRHGVAEKDIDIAVVPGAYEIPAVAKKMVDNNNYDAVICLGAVIKGATPHYDYVASAVSKSIAKISLKTIRPIINGIITADTLEQAIERAGTKMGNRGFEAATQAIEMANLMKKL